MENKIYYLYNQNEVLSVFIDKLEAYREYQNTPKNDYLPLEIIEIEAVGSIERANTIVTAKLNGKPVAAVVNSPKKAQEMIHLYEGMENDYAKYTFETHRIYT